MGSKGKRMERKLEKKTEKNRSHSVYKKDSLGFFGFRHFDY
jgi:hypothetical protein